MQRGKSLGIPAHASSSISEGEEGSTPRRNFSSKRMIGHRKRGERCEVWDTSQRRICWRGRGAGGRRCSEARGRKVEGGKESGASIGVKGPEGRLWGEVTQEGG